MANGLQSYFDAALQHMLLYQQEQERPGVTFCSAAVVKRKLCDAQLTMAAHVQILPDGAMPSSIYGGSHLLRLLVKLPEILPTLPVASQDRLQAGLVDFIVFLEDNAADFFTSKARSR